MILHWLWFFAFITIQCSATELIYTVTHYIANGQQLQFFMHQKSIDCLELWLHNKCTGDRSKALSNFYTPVAVRLLPDLNGFSFLQNDAVYIKWFNKRSPKRIEFYEPLYNINAIEWLDAQRFYFAAREHKCFRIYESDLEGNTAKIVSDDNIDAMYPQVIKDELFYIERNDQQLYSIIKAIYKQSNYKEVVLSIDKQIGFLKMVSAHHGFFLAYQDAISFDQELIAFSYYQLLKQDNNDWQYKRLFDFQIPVTYLVDCPDRVYESVVPFLPRYENKQIFGITYKNNMEHIKFCYEAN